MNQKSIVLAIMLLISLPMAILLGQWAATDPELAIGAGAIVIILFVIWALGRDVWLLIPLGAAFSGPVTALPGGFALRDLIIGLAFSALLVQWSIRRFHIRLRFGLIEAALLLQFVMVAQAFLRNPVGLAVLGSNEVGGRAYFEMVIAVLGFGVLSTQVVNLKLVNRAVSYLFAGSLLLGLLGGLALVFPAFGYAMTAVYAMSGASGAIARYQGVQVNQATEGRLPMLRDIARPLANGLFAKWAPTRVINPLRIFVFLIVIIMLGCTLYSGYRGMVAWLGMMAIASALAHKKMQSFFLVSLFVIPLVLSLVLLQGNLIQLPSAAQRALSFLPGDWDERIVQDADGSIDWRVEMWEQVLTTDRYITNKYVGDGFGFSQRELAFQMNLGDQSRNPELLQEYFMITGGYHSGPVETIRRVGYLGLGILLLGIGMLAKEAWALILKARNTPYQTAAFFVAIPILVFPLYFILIFGSYQAAIITMCLSGGLIRLIQNSMQYKFPESVATD